MTAPLCIAFIAGEYPPLQGGLGDYTRELGRALVQAGHDVRVVTRRVDTSAAPQDDAPGEPRVLRVVDGWGWRVWPTVRRAVAGADVVHIQYQTAAYGMHPFINTLPWLLRLTPPAPSPPSLVGKGAGGLGCTASMTLTSLWALETLKVSEAFRV